MNLMHFSCIYFFCLPRNAFKTTKTRPFLRLLQMLISGVSLVDLETDKLEKFEALLQSLNFLVRVELTSTEEPFLVNIFHPTVAGVNLG